MPQSFKLTEWFSSALRYTKNEDVIAGAKQHVIELKKINPRAAQELEAAISRSMTNGGKVE